MVKMLESILEKHKDLIVTKNDCPFCEQAKRLLKEKGVRFHSINMEESMRDRTVDFRAIIGELRSDFNHCTFPAIFLNGNFI